MTCPQHETVVANITDRFDRIDSKLSSIDEKLGDGKVNFATMQLRIQALEKVVYGALAIALASMATAVVSLVVR